MLPLSVERSDNKGAGWPPRSYAEVKKYEVADTSWLPLRVSLRNCSPPHTPHLLPPMPHLPPHLPSPHLSPHTPPPHLSPPHLPPPNLPSPHLPPPHLSPPPILPTPHPYLHPPHLSPHLPPPPSPHLPPPHLSPHPSALPPQSHCVFRRHRQFCV